MERLTKINDHEALSNEPLFSRMISRLKQYEDAEEQGYIRKCGKCGSYKISVEQGTFDEGGGYMNNYTDCTCDECGHKW